MRPCMVAFSEGVRLAKFVDIAIHLRFCPELIPVQLDCSGASALFCMGVSSDQSGLVTEAGTTGLDTAPLGGVMAGACAWLGRPGDHANADNAISANQRTAPRRISAAAEQGLVSIDLLKATAPGSGSS